MDNQEMQQVAWAITIAVGVCLPVWMLLGQRCLRREPLLRYEGRRPVPWHGIDVLVILSPYVVSLILSLAMGVVAYWSEAPVQENHIAIESDVDQEQLEKAHPLLKLLRQRRDPWAILLVVLSAVVVAPIAEEFFFRLVLQGWLEAAERKLRRRRPGLLPLRPGVWPIVLASILFAAIHIRPQEPPENVDVLLKQVTAGLITSPLLVAMAVLWLRFRSGATAVDFGVVPSRFLADCRTGLLAFLAIAMPIYGLQGLLTLIPGLVPDPITLFFFASTLGFLYGRTHRLVPAIVLHMALNGSSLAMAILL